MQFRLRTLFVAISCVCVILGAVVFVEWSWLGPARTGRIAQAKLDSLFSHHKWDGYAGIWHYDNRVRVQSKDVGDDQIKKLYPILHCLPWLRRIELYGTTITKGGIADIKKEFPNCHFIIKD